MGPDRRAWGRRPTRGERPLVIAHRGASAELPENTLAAFARAAALGADGVELDVMRCGSGEVVVFHDDTLLRLVGRPEAVRDLPLAALREVDLDGGGRIPTLAEVFESLDDGALVNVELKAPERRGLGRFGTLRDEGLADAVAALIARHGMAARALVSSFDPFLLRRFRRAAPEVAAGLLEDAESPWSRFAAWSSPLLRVQAFHPEAALVDARSLARWHRAGYAVHVWTVDDPREIAYLAALGVDGVITNRPREARLAVDRLRLP